VNVDHMLSIAEEVLPLLPGEWQLTSTDIYNWIVNRSLPNVAKKSAENT